MTQADFLRAPFPAALPLTEAETLGRALADDLRAQGAEAILADIG